MSDELYNRMLAELQAVQGQEKSRSKDLSEVATEEMLRKPIPGQGNEIIPGVPTETGRLEEPATAFQPIDSTTFKRAATQPEAEAFLDRPQLSRPLVDDLRIAFIRSSNRDVNPFALGDSPREVFNKAVSSGLLKPDFTPSEDMGALRSYWDQYQMQMRGGANEPGVLDDASKFLGAVARGAKSSVGPTLGAIAGGALGSVVSPLLGPAAPAAPISLGLGGSVVGGMAQESLFPTTPEEQAQVMFDYELPNTRWGRMVGQFLPQFLTDRPALISNMDKAINAGIAAGTDIGQAAAEYFGGKEIDPAALRDQLIFDISTAIFTRSNKLGQALYDRSRRKEIAALERRNQMAQAAAGGPAQAEQAQRNILDAVAEGLNTPEVTLGAGNMSKNVGLIALQAALERREGRLMQQRLNAKAATSKGLSEATALVGETPETAGEFARLQFEGQNAEMFAEAKRLHDSMVAQGQMEGALILQDAASIIQKLGSEAEAGRISAIEANARALSALNDAQSRLFQFSGNATKETASTTSKTRFASNEALSDKIVADAYAYARREGGPVAADFSNTWKAAKRVAKQKLSPSQKRAGTGLADGISAIIETYAPFQNGKFRTYSFESLRQELININSKLRLAPDGSQEKMQLSEIRAGLEKDLEKAADKHYLLKEANSLYKAHADKFDNGVSGSVYTKNPSEFLDLFMTGSVEELRRLRSALSDPVTGDLNAEAAMDIELYVANQLADSFGSQPKAKTLQEWRARNEATKIIEGAFPEIKPGIDKFIQDIADTEEMALQMTTALKKAEENKADVVAFNARLQKDAETRKAQRETLREKQAATKFAETQKQIIDSAATRFLGPYPVDAIKNIMDNPNVDPRREMAALIDSARKDPTGGAVEGIRNAVRKYLADESKLLAQVVVNENFKSAEVTPDKLAVSLRALNEQLDPTSKFRQTLDLVLDPREIEALKTVRRQLEILGRRTSLTQGESATTYNSIYDQVLREGLSGNMVNILGNLAKGVDPTRRAGLSRAILAFIDATKKVWKGDINERTQELMVDAMIDPAVAIEMLRPIKDITLPRARAFLQTWTLTKEQELEYTPLPFSVQASYEEDLANGTVTTDTANGYRIVQTPQKNFRLYSPEGEEMGLFRSFQEAEAKSLTDKRQRIMKQ